MSGTEDPIPPCDDTAKLAHPNHVPVASSKPTPLASKHIPTPASDATRKAAIDRLTPAQRNGLAFYDSALNALLDASDAEPRDDAKRVK